MFYVCRCRILQNKYDENFYRRVSGQRHIGEVHKNPLRGVLVFMPLMTCLETTICLL